MPTSTTLGFEKKICAVMIVSRDWSYGKSQQQPQNCPQVTISWLWHLSDHHPNKEWTLMKPDELSSDQTSSAVSSSGNNPTLHTVSPAPKDCYKRWSLTSWKEFSNFIGIDPWTKEWYLSLSVCVGCIYIIWDKKWCYIKKKWDLSMMRMVWNNRWILPWVQL